MNNYLKSNPSNSSSSDPANETRFKINEIKLFIKKNKKNTNLKEFAEKEFSDFNTKYPTLFRKLLEEDCDSKQLDYMLKQLENIQKGNKTQYDASVEIGQILVDKFVKPELNKKKE